MNRKIEVIENKEVGRKKMSLSLSESLYQLNIKFGQLFKTRL